MLFDLRGRGRRRVVQVVYLGLALLFGVGFIGFGVGVGGGSGGLLNFLSEEKNNGTASFAAQIKKQQDILKKHPTDAAAWAALVSAQLHEAGGESNYESATAKFTSKGKELLGNIAISWSHYLAVDSKPSPELAERMVTVFSEEGLNQPTQAVQALQIFLPSKPPSAALYGELAQFSYKAKNTREGDLASVKAVGLAPKSQRATLKKELEEIKKNPSASPSEAAAASQSSPAPTNTVKVGGKTYTVKQSSPTPAKSTPKSAKK